jgi:hypothetical protein
MSICWLVFGLNISIQVCVVGAWSEYEYMLCGLNICLQLCGVTFECVLGIALCGDFECVLGIALCGDFECVMGIAFCGSAIVGSAK